MAATDHSGWLSRGMPSSQLALAVLCLATACSPSTAANDGIAINVVPPRRWQTDPGPAQSVFPASDTCLDTDAFADSVWPLLTDHCVRCHAGAKLAAVRGLDLRDEDSAAAPVQLVCDRTLSSIDFDEPEQSDIFRSVDPTLSDVVHDFKFATVAELTEFRSTVLAWLSQETK